MMMEAKEPTPSVIGRLMGFEEISQPSQSIYRSCRVLSEDYFGKSDSIYLLDKRSYCKRRLSKVNSQMEQKIVNLTEAQGREKLHRNYFNLEDAQIGVDSRIGRVDEPHTPSDKFVIKPILSKSTSEMMLNYFSARKTNNRLWEKLKRAKGSKQTEETRGRNVATESCGQLRGKSEKGDHYGESYEDSGISTCAHSSTDLECEKATKEIRLTQDTPRESSKENQWFETSALNMKTFSQYSEKKHTEPNHCVMDSKDELHSYNFEDILEEDSLLSEGSLELSTFSSCSKINPEYFSPSPNSVLHPLSNEELSSSSDSSESIDADSNGLQMQLQLLKSESEEMSSERHGMVVSSDEDSEDESVGCHSEHKKFLGLFRHEECRDSSYLVDVLDKTSFFINNTNLGSKAWHPLDCPLDTLMFELLERKYDKHSSWDKSDRRLLFDRINLGLNDILSPYVHIFADRKPLGKSFKLSQCREVIEDELWRLLLSQENGVNRTVSEKALGTETKWFDTRDDVDLIVCEMEHFLFEKLSAELFYD